VTKKYFILATAGHVDHGKSTLVKALTGTDPDRLPEEKERGITIELGFAHLELHSPNESEIFSIGIVDVPGHEDFVKKMVSGAGAIDLALLVVAADDGWMPQSEEHLQILIYLGVPKIVVAMTKIDLAKSVETAEMEIRDQLRETPFAEAPLVKTAPPAGRGLTELKEQLAREFAVLAPQRDIDRPRLHVDRAFSLRGIGTVVTGTLTGGKLRRGDTTIVQPTKIRTRIRSLQNHNRDVEHIGPGARVALNLADLPIACGANMRGVHRGDVITRDALGEANATIDVLLTRSSRIAQSAPPLRNGAKIRLHHGSTNFPARVFFQSFETLAAGETTPAQLRLTTPIFAFTGDRFVVRDCSARQTVAGGFVLDPNAQPKNFRKPAQKKFLENCGVFPLKAISFVRAQLERDHVAVTSELLMKSCFSAEEISEALHLLASENKIVLRGRLAADAAWWRQALEKALAAIDAEHRNHPENTGLDLARLRGLFAKEAPEVVDALVADLARRGIAQSGGVVKRATHRAALPAHLQKAGADICRALSVKPFDPPSRKELARNPDANQALRFFLQKGEMVEVSDEVAFTSDAFHQMREAIVAFIRKQGPATVAELRQTLGSSRRVMVPLLERLDRDGITRRVGDRRTLTR
jgi:selenocysteine-specific elongation factor